jgi:hypothetical protein
VASRQTRSRGTANLNGHRHSAATVSADFIGGITLNGSTTTIRRSSSRETRGFRNMIWISSLMSLAIVFFGMQIMMVGPLQGRLDSITVRLDESQAGMKKLVGTRDGVWRTNDLLTSLEDQSARLADLKQSIEDIQTLRNQVENEAESATVALAALDRMTTLQRRIIGEQQTTQNATQQLARMEELQQNILQHADQVDVAANTFDGMLALQNRMIAASNGYEQASESVANLAELTQRMVGSSEQLQLAASQFDEFMGLTRSITAAGDNLDAARNSAMQLAEVKDEVLRGSAGALTAAETARTLVALNERLTDNGLQLDVASANLDALIGIEQSLGAQSGTIAEAIRNLEIMDDFQTEVASHMQSLETLRRTLIDIAMMESTLGRVARVVEPLTEIGNLRRLSQTEVQEAARIILDRRMTRFSQSDDDNTSRDTTSVETAGDQNLVPLPPEAREIIRK